jgi:hypothetical protein
MTSADFGSLSSAKNLFAHLEDRIGFTDARDPFRRRVDLEAGAF